MQMWRIGRPTLFLDAGQRGWVRRFQEKPDNAVWCIGRQRGKSFAALTLACEAALQTPGAIIRYAAKTKDSAKLIVLPTLEQVLQWCEPHLRPDIDETHSTVRWANGSVLTWAGTDAQSFDRLRGPRAHLILLDESGFYQDLEMVESALLPQLTTTKGKALYLSTPPDSMGHPFVLRFRSAQGAGIAEHETINDNPRLTKDDRARILKNFADTQGMTLEEAEASTFWRREYLAEFVTEESRAAIPAWNRELEAKCVRDYPRPAYFDGYVAIDWGFKDGHGALFGFFDFPAQKLVIERAWFKRGATVAEAAAAIKQIETQLWGTTKFNGTLYGAKEWGQALPDFLRDALLEGAPRQPLFRVGDDNALVLAECMTSHGLAVLPTRKDDKHLAIDALNQAFKREEIVILPAARELISQLYTTVWNKQRTEWERNASGHGEGVDCLSYMHRNIRRHRDPRPPSNDPWDRFQQRAETTHSLKSLVGLGRR